MVVPPRLPFAAFRGFFTVGCDPRAMDTPELILLGHAIFAIPLLAFGGLGFVNVSPTAGVVRALPGVLILALGLALYRVRREQQREA